MLREILDEIVDDNIRQRGYFYFIKKAVSNLKYTEKKASATVKGSKDYAVEIEFNKNRFPVQSRCTCPYNETGICKHIVAVMYKLNQSDFFNRIYVYPYIEDSSINTNIDDFFNDLVEDEPVDREEWIEDLKLRKEAAKFNAFKENIDKLIVKENRKKLNTNYKIIYAIQPKKYGTAIYPVRQKLKKDGTVSSNEFLRSVNFNIPDGISFQEKLIIERMVRNYGGLSINLYEDEIYSTYSNNHLNEAYLFSEILLFLSDKEVFLSNSYDEFEKWIYIQKEMGSAKLFIDNSEENLSLKLLFYFKGEEIKSGAQIIPVLDNPFWILINDNIFRISNLTFEQFHNFAEHSNNVLIPQAYLEYFEVNLLPQITKNLPISSNKYEIEEIKVTPCKRVYLEEDDSILKITLKFSYNGFEVYYNNSEETTVYLKVNKIVKIIRDKNLEESARQELKSFFVKEIDEGIFVAKKNPLKFLFEALPALKEMEYEIFGEANLNKFKVNVSKPIFTFSVSSNIDWFDVKTGIKFNGTGVPFEELQNAIKNKREYVQLDDGSAGILPQKWMNKLQRAFTFGELGKDNIRFSKIQANALEQLIKDGEEVITDDEFKKHVETLNSFEKILPKTLPDGLKAILRPYQKAGFDWLYFLKEYNFGGILADDMGLGKTIQVLAFLLNEKVRNENQQHLIIAPTSVVFNWMKEAEKFAPSLRILNHTGNERNKDGSLHFNEYDIILTSYSILLRDNLLFTSKEFDYIILDESQKIKNPAAKTARLIRTLHAKHRLCLTGTPVENNLNELWSQVSFLNPGMLGTLKKFNEAFVKPIQRNNDESAAEDLRKTVYPFILRRRKEVVAKELPEKTEVVHYCEMELSQQKIYNVWRDSIRNDIMKEIEEKGIRKTGFKVIEGLLRLRQICNHPLLVKADSKSKSGKFEEFKEHLEKVLSENHKVLVFSQFVQMLNIIKAYLDKQNILYEVLTGSTIDRECCVDNFQNNEKVKIFLISLKAGGFGLNLTAADYVFHYDPWWNPAVEEQATDRTHRIGQSKNVFVYKFVTKDSVEEKILQLQKKKKKLVENIITSETGVLKNLQKEDIDILFT